MFFPRTEKHAQPKNLPPPVPLKTKKKKGFVQGWSKKHLRRFQLYSEKRNPHSRFTSKFLMGAHDFICKCLIADLPFFISATVSFLEDKPLVCQHHLLKPETEPVSMVPKSSAVTYNPPSTVQLPNAFSSLTKMMGVSRQFLGSIFLWNKGNPAAPT